MLLAVMLPALRPDGTVGAEMARVVTVNAALASDVFPEAS
jgi:hypothetical protein